jgi:hypothetical protein
VVVGVEVEHVVEVEVVLFDVLGQVHLVPIAALLFNSCNFKFNQEGRERNNMLTAEMELN